jgi:hypothetical protein
MAIVRCWNGKVKRKRIRVKLEILTYRDHGDGRQRGFIIRSSCPGSYVRV